MAYVPVGIDEDSKFPPEVEDRLMALITTPVEELNDPAVSNLINDTESATRDSLNATIATAVERQDVAVAGDPAAAHGIVDPNRAALPSTGAFVRDSVHEWWATPIATKVGRITYSCGYSSKGEVIAWDEHDRDGLTTVVVSDAGTGGPGGDVDDHDAPVRWVSDAGDFSLIVHNHHGDTDYVSVRVSLDGTARGFAANPQVDLVIANGAQISYNQVFLHSVSGDTYTFWVIVRSGAGWVIRVFTVDRQTAAVSSGTLYRLGNVGSQQSYFMAVQDGRTLRASVYVNPAYDTHAIWVMHIDLDSLLMTNPMDSGMSHDIAGGSYFNLATTTPLVPETVTTDTSRRMYYPHPTDDRVVYSEWTRGAEADAQYIEAANVGGTVTYRTLGPAAGPRNGYTAAANYNPGAAYSPDGSKIATLHNTDEGGEVWIHTASRSWLTRRTAYALSRPAFVDDNELMWLAVDHYTDYFSFLMHQVSQVGFPEIEGVPTNAHPLVASQGTLWLIDPTFDTSWDAGLPSTVPNLADGTTAALSVSTSGGVTERTTKGALHVAPPKDATGNQSVVIASPDVRNALVSALTDGHEMFMGEVYRITREPDETYAPTSTTTRFLGIISSTSGDFGSLRLNTLQEVGGYPTTNGEQKGSALVADGPQAALAAVLYTSGLTAGSSNAITVLHNGGPGSPMPARITYLSIIEDLTVSGRTYAEVAAEVNAWVATEFGAGGRYSDDDWTTP